jgi:hypothetical protein
MSKRSRDAYFSLESEKSPSPACEDGLDAMENLTPPTKYSQTDSDAAASLPAKVMECILAPHREAIRFNSQEAYEVHYAEEHTNRCKTCSKNFPTSHYLDLHIEENHNALREELAARGEKTYGCLVEGCDRKCSTPQKRRLHLIDKHMFPKNYNFRIVDRGTDKAFSMLREGRRRCVSTAGDIQETGRHRRQASSRLQHQSARGSEARTNSNATSDVNEDSEAKVKPHVLDIPKGTAARKEMSEAPASEVDSLAHSLSALRFVPISVFRKQKGKTNSSG